MTREEAIRHIRDVIAENNSIKPNIVIFEQEKEALYMAIEALSADAVTHGRLIDADALSEKLCATTIFIKDGEAFQRMINDAPTVSADAVQGEWTDIDNYYRLATCSRCHKVAMFEKWGEDTRPYNYCPNCGAKMKGGDTE